MEGMGKFGWFFVQMMCRRGVVGSSWGGFNIKFDVEGIWISV
jgi:hypothetical protein